MNRCLLRLNFDEVFTLGYPFPFLLEPLANLYFTDGFADGGYFDVNCFAHGIAASLESVVGI